MNTPTSSHGSGLQRPHSRAQPRPSSSSSHARPLSSLSTARPLSSASLRPQSRLSRPSSRISRPVTRHTARLLPLCQSLVTHITRLSPDNDPENYRIAVDFALKNLEHALKGGASTDMTTMDKRFRGHVQKARINNQDSLANALEKAYTRVKGHAKDLIDIDEEIKLSHLPDHLQLLLLLSATPSRSTLAFADTYGDRDSPEKEPPLTWKDILAEEPLEGQHLGRRSTIEGWETKGTDSDSSLSTWDDLDSIGNDDGDEDVWNRPSEDPPSQGVHTPDTTQRTVPSHVPKHLTAVEELKAQQYWRDDWHIGVDVNRPFDLGDPSTLGPTMLRVRGEKEPLSLSGPEREKHIFERDAVREVLMCLQGRKNFLIYTTTDTFRSVPSPTAPRLLHFTLTAQSSILSAFAEVTTTVCHLRKFAAAIVENVSSSYNLPPNPAHLLSHSIRSRTIEAFADAVNAQIQRFDSWCAAKEEAISFPRTSCDTFAGTFDVLLNLLHRFVGYVSQSHDRRDLAVWKIPNMPTRIPPSASVEEQATLGNTQTSDALISVLARTTEPTWELVGKWLLDGMPSRRPWDSADAPSLDEEFFIEDNELQIMDPDFWSDGYVLRGLVTLEENQKTQPAVPAFLEPAVIQILGAGKAVGLLREMGTRVFTEHSDGELLNLGTFRALIDTNSAVSKDSEALSRLISEEISAYCLTVAMRLSCVMTEECDLQRHLSAIHGLFLTTRGDDINTFTDILFAKMDAQKHWTDFHSLNSAFSDVIELNESNWIDASLVRLSYRGNKAASASQTVKAIDGLLVEYAVPFPLTYIFTPNVLQSYCSIFVFLLQIRRAKSVLEQILLRSSVANAALRSELKVFYAMRGKLSWFINTIFNFVTTFVIHSQLIKFWEAVNQAKSLDELITIHNDHLDMLLRECFLHSSTAEISKAIVSILDMCLHFRSILRRHKSRRQRRIRRNVIGFSQPGARFDSDDDSSDTDLDEEGLKEAPETSFSIAPSLAQEDPSEQLEKLSSELDSLVRYIRKVGTSDAAQASGILAFTLDDWDS
ncbi:Spc98 family-domain-containing protein [Pisolithus tinctorius]|nr:Spc98 family-domain-containing protein [Pisolithus tinctorius]